MRRNRLVVGSLALAAALAAFALPWGDRGASHVHAEGARPLCVTCAPALRGDPTLARAVAVKEWGYAIRPIDEWNSIPAQPDEKFVVGGWQPDMEKAQLRGDWSMLGCTMQIVRVEVSGGTTASDAEAKKREDEKDKAKEEISKRLRDSNWEKRTNPKSIDDWIEGNYEGASKRYVPQRIKAGKMEGELLEFTSGRTFVCIGRFRHGTTEWAVVYEAPEEHYDKTWKKVYRKSVESFRLFEPEGRPKRLLTPEEMKKLSPEEKREAIKQQIAGNPGWYAIDTENYVFLSNSKKKSFIRSLAREIETLREKVYEELFPPQKEITAVCIVRVLSSQAEYHQYGGPPGSAGYWNSRSEELVLFDDFDGVTKRQSKEFTAAVMYHEAFHQYIHYAIGELAPHSWFNEGHGDYFAGARIRGSRVSLGPFEWRTDYLKQHLRDGKTLIPTRSLVRLPQNEYYSNAGLKYSQGWALIYFLRSKTDHPEWKKIPEVYFDYLSKNIAAFRKKKKEEEGADDTTGGGIPGLPGITIVDFEDAQAVERILEEAVDKAFEGIDYEELDRAFQSWVESIT